jgi:spore maturation protein CgeB
MRVLIYDMDFKTSGTVYPIKSAFEVLGHTADMFDWRKYLFSYINESFTNNVKDKLLFDLVAYKINKDLRKMIKHGSYDFFLVIRGDHVYPDTIAYAKKNIPVVANWSTDDLFNKLNSSKYILSSIDQYDIYFSPRKHLQKEYLDKGAKSFELLNWYYRPGLVFNEIEVRNFNYLSDICFIGAWSSSRENLLMSLKESNLKLCGWGWNKKLKMSIFDKWDIKPHLKMTAMMSTFSKSKININILTRENRDTTNLRNYEIAIAGGFQLSERSSEVLEIFNEDVEIVCFSTPEELKSKCEFYLKNDNLREKIALAGYHRIINGNNSLIDRVKQIVDIIK